MPTQDKNRRLARVVSGLFIVLLVFDVALICMATTFEKLFAKGPSQLLLVYLVFYNLLPLLAISLMLIRKTASAGGENVRWSWPIFWWNVFRDVFVAILAAIVFVAILQFASRVTFNWSMEASVLFACWLAMIVCALIRK